MVPVGVHFGPGAGRTRGGKGRTRGGADRGGKGRTRGRADRGGKGRTRGRADRGGKGWTRAGDPAGGTECVGGRAPHTSVSDQPVADGCFDAAGRVAVGSVGAEPLDERDRFEAPLAPVEHLAGYS